MGRYLRAYVHIHSAVVTPHIHRTLCTGFFHGSLRFLPVEFYSGRKKPSFPLRLRQRLFESLAGPLRFGRRWGRYCRARTIVNQVYASMMKME